MRNNLVIKRLDVCSTFHRGFKRKIKSIEEIVIHGTPGKSANGLINWMLAGERGKQYKRGIALFHFLIGRLGEIYQFAPISRWYYHSSSGRHDKKTIGIELLNSMPGNVGSYTERQMVTLEDLLFNELFEMCPNVRRIVSHDYNNNTYSGNRKDCPGVNFSWTQVRDMFKHRKIDICPEIFVDVVEFEPIMLKGKIGGV